LEKGHSGRFMNAPIQVRRATVEDLPGLRLLWEKAKLDSRLLERRLTEFQVIESDGLIACIGIEVADHQGLVHSEAIANFTRHDQLGPMLWDRIQTLARNHGLHRLWIDDPDPAWIRLGFIRPTAQQLKKLPPKFGARPEWHVLQLKEETIATLSLEQEFELFSQGQKQSTEQILRQARRFKQLAYILLWLAVGALIAFLVYGFRHPVDVKRLAKPPAIDSVGAPAPRR
jgi:N-acetylglutamate synthase-like GNAT family acetyltransferase